jgi:hypothetical protein
MNFFTRPRHLDGYHKRAVRTWFLRHGGLVRKISVRLGIPLLAVVAIGFVPFSCDGIARGVERAVVKAGASSCSVRKATLRPWLGLSLERVRVDKKEWPAKVSLEVPRVRLAYRLPPLLFKVVVIRNVVFERPKISVSLSPAPSAEAKNARAFGPDKLFAALAALPFSPAVENVSLADAEVSVTRGGSRLVDGKGVDLRVNVRRKRDSVLFGKLGADTLTLGGMWNVTGARASLRADEISATLEHCMGDFYGGTIAGSGRIGLETGSLERFKLELYHVNLAGLYAACGVGKGRCDGRCEGELVLDRSAFRADALRGRGFVKMSDVVVRDSPLQSGVIVYIAVPQLRNIAFDRLGTSIEVRNGRILTPDVSGDGNTLRVRAEGWVGFDGVFFENVKGIIAADVAEKLHPLVSRSLGAEADDKKSFSCTMSGTLANPEIRIDRAVTQRVVRNLFDEVGKFFRGRR